jgi:hypothetical protein
MTLHVYMHSKSKRAKTIALLDLEATENFISLDYAKYLPPIYQNAKSPKGYSMSMEPPIV